MNIDLTAEPSEIVQAEEPYDPARPINVAVCGPVQTRELPANAHPGYSTASGVTDTLGVRVLGLEPRRKYAVLVAQDQDMWVSTSQAGAQAGIGGAMRWAAQIPYPVGHVHEVWVCAVTGTTDISVETVNWSE